MLATTVTKPRLVHRRPCLVTWTGQSRPFSDHERQSHDGVVVLLRSARAFRGQRSIVRFWMCRRISTTNAWSGGEAEAAAGLCL